MATGPTSVEGPENEGATPTSFPLRIAGTDIGGALRTLRVDSSGRLEVIGSVNLEEGGVLVTNTPHGTIDFDINDFDVTDNGDGSATITIGIPTDLTVTGSGAAHRVMIQNTLSSGELLNMQNDVGTTIFEFNQDASPGSAIFRAFDSASALLFEIEGGEVTIPKFVTAEDNTLSTTTSTAFVNKLTTSFTPGTAGDDWCIYWYAEIRNVTDEEPCEAQTTVNATVVGNTKNYSETGAFNDWAAHTGFAVLTGLAAALQTINIDFRTGPGEAGTAEIQRARIMVERIA